MNGLTQEWLAGFETEHGDQNQWLKKMKDKLGREIFQRKLHADAGPMSNVEHEIFHGHVKDMCAALARCDTKEAATRKL